MCGWLGLGLLVCLVAFMVVWGWVSYPVWWDPTFRDREAFLAFTGRLSIRKRLLGEIVGVAVLILVVRGATGC